MGSRQRGNPLLGGMDGPTPQIVRPRTPNTSTIVEHRSNATLKLLAATALVGMVLLAFAGHHEHAKATAQSIHFFQRRDLAGSAGAPTPALALHDSSAASFYDASGSGYPLSSQAPAPAPAGAAAALSKALGSTLAGKAKAPAPSAPAPAPGKKAGGSAAGKAQAPVSTLTVGKKVNSSFTGKAGKATDPKAPAPAPALGRKGGKAVVAHAPVPVPAPAGHAGQTKGKKEATLPIPAGHTKGKKGEAKAAGKHALAPAPEGMHSKGAKKVEGKGKGKDVKAAGAPKAHAPAPGAGAAAKEPKKSSGWLPSILALPGTGTSTRTPAGGKSKGLAGAPAFAPAPGLGGAAAAFLRPVGAPKEAKAMKLVSPISTDHLFIPASAPAPSRAARKGQAAAVQAPAPTPVRSGTGFASLGNVFG